MQDFQNILVGIDISQLEDADSAKFKPPTEEAIRQSIRLAGQLAAKPTFFAAIDASEHSLEDLERLERQRVTDTLTDSAKRVLDQLNELEQKLGTSQYGLTSVEAQKRLTQYGPNEIEEKKAILLLKFFSYFWDPIPWMIEIAVILSAAVGHWEDFGIILFLPVFNGVIGFWEERQAGNAIDAWYWFLDNIKAEATS